jgi:Zn-dependent alcohol dehydrogenase
VLSAGWVTTFSDYTIAPENGLIPALQDAPGDVVALLGCAVSVSCSIMLGCCPGSRSLFLASAASGLNVVQGGDLVNAYPIVALDHSDAKFEFSRQFGATHSRCGRDRLGATIALQPSNSLQM